MIGGDDTADSDIGVGKLALMKKKLDASVDFGRRLADLRRGCGITQVELARKVGTTQRMITYYERESERPPAVLLPKIAKALRVSVDRLLGLEPVKERVSLRDARVLNRVRKILILPPTKQRAVIEHLESLVARHGNGDKQKAA